MENIMPDWQFCLFEETSGLNHTGYSVKTQATHDPEHFAVSH